VKVWSAVAEIMIRSQVSCFLLGHSVYLVPLKSSTFHITSNIKLPYEITPK